MSTDGTMVKNGVITPITFNNVTNKKVLPVHINEIRNAINNLNLYSTKVDNWGNCTFCQTIQCQKCEQCQSCETTNCTYYYYYDGYSDDCASGDGDGF